MNYVEHHQPVVGGWTTLNLRWMRRTKAERNGRDRGRIGEEPTRGTRGDWEESSNEEEIKNLTGKEKSRKRFLAVVHGDE